MSLPGGILGLQNTYKCVSTSFSNKADLSHLKRNNQSYLLLRLPQGFKFASSWPHFRIWHPHSYLPERTEGTVSTESSLSFSWDGHSDSIRNLSGLNKQEKNLKLFLFLMLQFRKSSNLLKCLEFVCFPVKVTFPLVHIFLLTPLQGHRGPQFLSWNF